MSAKPITILMADDDADDCLLVKEVFEKGSPPAYDLRFVTNGEKLMDYLHRRGPYADPSQSPRPGLILLDLNMPRKDGREALKEIKSDGALRKIPIVVFTTSRAEQDILKSYDLGANSFVTKPVSFQSLVEVIDAIITYWFGTAKLPEKDGSLDPAEFLADPAE